MTQGLYDDFSFDYGWSTTASASEGLWERAIPAGVEVASFLPNPDADSPLDCGKYAFVTDNDPGLGGSGSVAQGTVTLISPIFDVTNMSDPHIYYERWFFCYHGFEPFNDTLKVVLSNGSDFVTIDTQGSDLSVFGKWIPKSLRVEDYITPTTTMQLFVSTSDSDASANITEAGLDNFRVTDGSILNLDETVAKFNESVVYPNPFTDRLTIEGSFTGEISLLDLTGKKIDFKVSKSGAKTYIETIGLTKGVYVLKMGTEIRKVVKQ